MSAALDRPRHPILRGALVGAGLGVVWGVGVRVFMRLVSDNPSFSWVGTLFILGLAALMGTGLGILAAAKAHGGRRWWRLAVLPGLMLLAGQGMPFIPAFLLGSLAFSRRHPALRALGVVAIGGGVWVLWWLVHLNTDTMLGMPTAMLVRGLIAFTILSVAMAAAASVLWRPWAPRPSQQTEPGVQDGVAQEHVAQEQVAAPASSGVLAPAVPTSAQR